MKIITSIAAMQRLAQTRRRAGLKIGFVPTMGFLHEGHLSLVKRARKLVGGQGMVVLSIYVNPTQFGPKEDFSRYPRDMARDTVLCREAGVDVVFAPSDEEMYPKAAGSAYSTYVVEESLTQPMEGVTRPGHFRGVTTIVAKLFNIVLPDVAVFGAKDWQQAAVVRRMTRDLNFPLKLVVAPTSREKDGLAMSSRNKYLDAEQRSQAVVLSQVLAQARERVRATNGLASRKLGAELTKLIQEKAPAGRLDYLEIFDPESLQPLASAAPGAHLALAVWFGSTRLIDNGPL